MDFTHGVKYPSFSIAAINTYCNDNYYLKSDCNSITQIPYLVALLSYPSLALIRIRNLVPEINVV